MLEKLTETLAKFQSNPLDALKNIMAEEKKLQNWVIENRPSTKMLVEFLEKTYTKEEINDLISWDWTLQNFIEWKMKPSLWETMLSEITQPFADIQSVLSWSDLGTTIDEYASLFHKQPCDPKEIENWMKAKGMIVEEQAESNTLPTGRQEQQPIEDKKENTDTKNIEPAISWSSEIISEKPQLDKIIELAKSEIGTNEKDNSADKYFKELWYKHDSKKVPWCGAFVSWTLMKAGFPIPKNDLSAKAFIDESGKWHVWIKVADKIVSWNYWNKVSSDTMDSIDKKIVWYAIPTVSGLEIHKEKIKFDDIPEGAVVVFDRDAKRSQAA